MEINALLIIVAVIFIVGAVGGWKQGLIDGIIALVSFILGMIVLAIVATAVGGYIQKSYVKVTVAVVLLIVIGIINKLVKLVLDTFKLLRAIPIGNIADKLAGVVLGVAEALVVTWIVFFLLDNVTILDINEWVFDQISQNEILTKLYDVNIIESIIAGVK